jgi:hypothetical protein
MKLHLSMIAIAGASLLPGACAIGPHHPYTHPSSGSFEHGANDLAYTVGSARTVDPDDGAAIDAPVTYSPPAAPTYVPAPSLSTHTYTVSAAPTYDYAAPAPTYDYAAPAPHGNYTTTTRTYTTTPTYSYAAPVSAPVGPDTHVYIPGDRCAGGQAHASGPLVGNMSGGTRYACGGYVDNAPRAAVTTTTYTAAPPAYSYSSVPGSTYRAPPTRERYTYIPGQVDNDGYNVPLQGGSERAVQPPHNH